MEVATDAGAVLGLAAQLQYRPLQLAGSAAALPRALDEEVLQVRTLDVVGADLEAGLAVLAGLDQVVEYTDDFFAVVCDIHGSVLPGRRGVGLAEPMIGVGARAGPTLVPTRGGGGSFRLFSGSSRNSRRAGAHRIGNAV
ncbi:hypothetical protein D9M71_767820 [compost metagenome]